MEPTKIVFEEALKIEACQDMQFYVIMVPRTRCCCYPSCMKCASYACGQSMRVFGGLTTVDRFHGACEFGHGTAAREELKQRFCATLRANNIFGRREGPDEFLFFQESFFLKKKSAALPLASSNTPSNYRHFQRDNSSGVLFGLIRRLFLDASCASTGLYSKIVCSINEASA